jgi:hypothetical protein
MGQNDDQTCPVCSKPFSTSDAKYYCNTCHFYVHKACTGAGKEIFEGLVDGCERCVGKTEYGRIVYNIVYKELRKSINEVNEVQKKLQERIDGINSKLDLLDKRSKPVIAVSWAYLAVFIIMVAVTAFLFWLGWGKEVKASINYNVGEIIGGLLAGTGAAVAGTAYALKTLRKEKE